MIDLVIICLISWFAWTGYRLGGPRSLMQLSGIVGMIFIVETTSPWLRLATQDSGFSLGLTHWLEHVLAPVVPAWRRAWEAGVPATARGDAPTVQAIARSLYLDLTTGGYAVAVYFGLHMAFKSLETLWPYGGLKHRRARLGALLGGLVGLFVSMRMLGTLLFFVYLNHLQGAQALLYHSVFVHAWTGWIAHGIVE